MIAQLAQAQFGGLAGLQNFFVVILIVCAIGFLVWLIAWWAIDRIVAAIGVVPKPINVLIVILRVIIIVVAAFWIIKLLLGLAGAHF